MPNNVTLPDGGVLTPSQPQQPLAPVAPTVLDPVSPPPSPPPVAAAAPVDLGAVEAAAAAAAASSAALLAGGDSEAVAAAAAAAGGTPATVAALQAADIPGTGSVVVASTTPSEPAAVAAPTLDLSAVEAAAAAASAAANALLAGGGSEAMAQAAADAGAPPSEVAAILALNIPDLTGLDVTSTNLAGGSGGSGGDEAMALLLALANDPDLSGLSLYELLDPFGFQEAALTNPPLKGGGALDAIAQACSDDGVDTLAAIACAIHAGANGSVGDAGYAYGPFHLHLTDKAGSLFFRKGKNNKTVNAWAWSHNGIVYAVRQLVVRHPSAKGLSAHPAVSAITYGDPDLPSKSAAYKTRAAEYDRLHALGSGWARYAAPLFLGPGAGGGVDTAPINPVDAQNPRPSGVGAEWRGLVAVYGTDVPNMHERVKALASSYKGIFT